MIDYIDIISRTYPGTQCSIIGDPSIYSNIVWVGTPIPQSTLDAAALSIAQRDVNDQITAYRDTWSKNYMAWNNDTWQCDDISKINVMASNTIALLNGGVLPAGFTWRNVNNVNVPMTAAQMGALGAQMSKFITICYQTSWNHKASVMLLTTVADVLAYNYTTLWPSRDVQI
jgi:hypothetical protein